MGTESLVPWAGVARKCIWLGEKCGKAPPCLYAGSCAWKTSCLLPPRLCSHGAEDEQLHLVLVLLRGSPRHQRSVVSCHEQG